MKRLLRLLMLTTGIIAVSLLLIIGIAGGAPPGQEVPAGEEEEETVDEGSEPEEGVIVMLSGDSMTLDIEGLLTTLLLGEDAECTLAIEGMDEASFPCSLLQVGATVSVASEETEEGGLKAVAVVLLPPEDEEEVEGSPVVAILGGQDGAYGLTLAVENEAETDIQIGEAAECYLVREGMDDASMPCSDLHPGQMVEVETEEAEEGVFMATVVYLYEG